MEVSISNIDSSFSNNEKEFVPVNVLSQTILKNITDLPTSTSKKAARISTAATQMGHQISKLRRKVNTRMV